MAIITGSATVPSGTAATLLFPVPPSYCSVTFWNPTATAVWVGTSTATTSANGMQANTVPTTFRQFAGTKSATFYGTTGSSSSAATIVYLISTSS